MAAPANDQLRGPVTGTPQVGRALARAATGDGLVAELTPHARLGEPQQ
jgi:hypothetical protein